MVDIKDIISIIVKANELVMQIYRQNSYHAKQKPDRSWVTRADQESHDFICEQLRKYYLLIPIISEESSIQQKKNERKKWSYCFLVDPLDGTKEFLEKNGEFTINIALIKNHEVVLGVMGVPAQGVIYFAERGKGAYKIIRGSTPNRLPLIRDRDSSVRVVVSRSHHCPLTENFLLSLQQQSLNLKIFPLGSALKFGWIAEGRADIYPRFAPTMEWDTAAGHILVNEIGKRVTIIDSEQTLQYNKKSLINPFFIVQ